MSPVYEQLEDVANYAETHTIHGWQLHPREAAAFCQHYGLPTHMFDFTASADVAVFFSANRQVHKHRARVGRVGVLDVRKARDNACAVFDLRQFTKAKRPQKQHGFGMMRAYFGEDDILDLKDPDLSRSIGLEWVEFAHLPDDETFLYLVGADDDLLSLQDDAAARLPQDLVDQYVSREGALLDEVARILSGEISPISRTADENYRGWSGQ
jgi:FRG domain